MENFEKPQINQHEESSNPEKKESWLKKKLQYALITTTLLATIGATEGKAEEIEELEKEPTEIEVSAKEIATKLQEFSDNVQELIRLQIEIIYKQKEETPEIKAAEEEVDEIGEELVAGIEELEELSKNDTTKRDLEKVIQGIKERKNNEQAEETAKISAIKADVDEIGQELLSNLLKDAEQSKKSNELMKRDLEKVLGKYEGAIAKSTSENEDKEINIQETDDKVSTSKDEEIIYKQKEEETKEKETKDITGEDLTSNKNEKNDELKSNIEEKSEFSDWTLGNIKNKMLELQNLRYERTLTSEEMNQKTELRTVLQEKLQDEFSEEQMSKRLYEIQSAKKVLDKEIGDSFTDKRWDEVSILSFEEKALEKVLNK